MAVVKPATLRDYTCECANPKCRVRIYLSVGTYNRLARMGRVVAPYHSVPVIFKARDAHVVV